MWKKVAQIARGFGFFLIIAFGIGFFIYLRIGGLEALAKWLSQSSNPRMALITFSVFMTSVILVLIRLGFEVAPLNRWVSSEKVRSYVAGLPAWFLFAIIAIAVLVFWRYSPSCLPPSSVQFEVAGSGKTYPPLSTIEVKPGEALTLIAKTPDNNPTLGCYWEYSGSAFGGIKTQPSGCQISLKFRPEGGEGVITVATTQNFCTQKSLFSIKIYVRP